MNRSKWMKPLLQITVAAALTSLLSVSVSILFVPDISNMNTALVRHSTPIILSGSQAAVKHSSNLKHKPVSYAQAVANASFKSDAANIQQAVKDAIDALAKHPSFASWKGAVTKIQPLGPGTHGWIVHIISPAKKPLGYMIIHATEQGDYSLTEYGTGEHYPFNKQTLNKAIAALDWPEEVQLSAEPYYIKPLLGVWKIKYQHQTEWLDAATGEVLYALELHNSSAQPINKASLITSKPCGVRSATGIILSTSSQSYSTDSPAITGSSFDPYDNISWMADPNRKTGENASRELKAWNPEEGGKPYIYVLQVSSRKDETGSTDMNFPYALIGKQAWNPVRTNSKPIEQSDACKHTTVSTAYYAVKASGDADLRYIAEPLLVSNGYISSADNPKSH